MAGGAVAKADPDSTGLNPAWRKTLGEVYVTVGWPAGSPNSVVNLAVESLKNNTEIIDRLSVDSASYLNEVRFLRYFFAQKLNTNLNRGPCMRRTSRRRISGHTTRD